MARREDVVTDGGNFIIPEKEKEEVDKVFSGEREIRDVRTRTRGRRRGRRRTLKLSMPLRTEDTVLA